jgi:hypothetical protein
MGKVAYENNDFYNAVKWFNLTVNMLSQEKDDANKSGQFEFNLLDHFANATYFQGNADHSFKLTLRLLEMGLIYML